MGIRTLYQNIAAIPAMRQISRVANWLAALGGLLAAMISGYRAFDEFFKAPVFSIIEGNGWMFFSGLACAIVTMQYVGVLFGVDLLDRDKNK